MTSYNIRAKKGNGGSDDYETTEAIWKHIIPFVSLDETIYEPFYCSGKSKEILEGLGYTDVIHEKEDFFTSYHKYNYDVIISNPPYSIKKKIFDKLREIDKKFIMIVPVSVITKQYFMENFKDTDITILIPPKRMQFNKSDLELSRCCFDTIFVCYKFNLGKQIIYI